MQNMNRNLPSASGNNFNNINIKNCKNADGVNQLGNF